MVLINPVHPLNKKSQNYSDPRLRPGLVLGYNIYEIGNIYRVSVEF